MVDLTRLPLGAECPRSLCVCAHLARCTGAPALRSDWSRTPYLAIGIQAEGLVDLRRELKFGGLECRHLHFE